MENNSFDKLTLEELEQVYDLNAKTHYSLLDKNTINNLSNELTKRREKLFNLKDYLNRYFKERVGDSITYIHFIDICNDELLADVIDIEDKHVSINYSQNYTFMLDHLTKFYKEVSPTEYNAVYNTISKCCNNILSKY